MSNKHEPAFPAQPLGTDGKPVNEMATGLTKREYIATQLIAGIMANSIPGSHHQLDVAVKDALEYADALLSGLERTHTAGEGER